MFTRILKCFQIIDISSSPEGLQTRRQRRRKAAREAKAKATEDAKAKAKKATDGNIVYPTSYIRLDV